MLSRLEDDNSCGADQDEIDNEALGNIRIDLYRVVFGGATAPPKYISPKSAALPSTQPDNKKAAVHHTSYVP